jgi:ribosomal protein S10
VVTLLISPHKHHAAQEQFCRDIHRRVVWLTGELTPKEIESLSKIKLSNQAKLNLKFVF